MEVELKLLIDASDIGKLLKDPLLKPAAKTRSRQIQLENIYFDTAERELQAARIGLRLRRIGNQWLQTIKGGGQVIGGLHARPELEYPVSSRVLDFEPAADSPWAAWFDVDRVSRLAPVFATNFHRTVRLLRPAEDVEIELALDQGEIVVADKSEPLCEIELELKRGPVSALFDLALALAERFHIQIENASKAERGYRLAYGESVTPPQKWALPMIDDTMPLFGAVQALADSLFGHFQQNERGFLTHPDDLEYLHQMRVALRRLRVLLGTFRDVLPDPATVQHLNGELRWLGGLLGEARDWDVLLNETLPPLLQNIGPHPARSRLHARLVACGYSAHDEARLALTSRRYQLCLLTWGRYFTALAHHVASTTFGEALVPLLQRQSKRLQKALQAAAEVDEALHQSRIQAKKLRYLGEFSETTFAGRRYERYADWLARLQTELGRSNDHRVAIARLAGVMGHIRKTDEAELIGMLRGWLMASQLAPQDIDRLPPKPYW
ncbi:inorganic triphosphatase YgiF [Chitinivorax tropicus]|uniref:Inorganic triphosphatase YgiF n=1 Tax=Chitinivorax tropicus TaxID=714531 RepID=A0A840MRK7_9PROT|nr:CYTH and CHAD domain-containing protein [Chitinivorax tropicus]MBB5020055.1 inorganic triphosphatase YgiF [Chitinivorax tropicus]